MDALSALNDGVKLPRQSPNPKTDSSVNLNLFQLGNIQLDHIRLGLECFDTIVWMDGVFKMALTNLSVSSQYRC